MLSTHHRQQDSASPRDPRALQKRKDRSDTTENGDFFRDTALRGEGDRDQGKGDGNWELSMGEVKV